MNLLVTILFVFLGLYALLLIWLATGFLKEDYFKMHEDSSALPVTIIICARNEARFLPYCLNTIMNQQYEKSAIEILFVNDASTDNTLTIASDILGASGIKHRIMNNASRLGKKKSLAAAIGMASNELIITRDADSFCLSQLWLKSISDFYARYPSDMIIAPVALTENKGLMWALQAIENNILALVACGSNAYKKPFLCSGANLVFTKQAYSKTEGYKNHEHIESGDDVLFLNDLRKIPGSVIRYLKHREAIVHTFPQFSLGNLLQQKIRWASKFKTGGSSVNFSLAILSFIANAGWLFCLLYGFIRPQNNALTLVFVVGKLVVDILLLLVVSGFIKSKSLIWYSLPVGFIYPVYTCMVGLGALFLKPVWKR